MTKQEELLQQLEHEQLKLEQTEAEITRIKSLLRLYPYPNDHDTYYFLHHEFGKTSVHSSTWYNSTLDKWRWENLHGSLDKYKVFWVIENHRLIEELKPNNKIQQTNGDYNINFILDKQTGRFYVGETEWFEQFEWNNFKSMEEINKVIEKYGMEYLSKFLYQPLDNDYKSIMKWFNNTKQ